MCMKKKKTNNLTNVKISIANEENYYEFKPTSIWLYKQQMFRCNKREKDGEGSIQTDKALFHLLVPNVLGN